MDQTVSQPLANQPLPAETANQITHGLGFAASLAGVVVLMVHLRAGADIRQVLGCTVYGTSLVALFAASTLSHSFQRQRLRDFFRMLDQICIFLVIAGSFTPYALVHLREGHWWTLLPMMWLMALVGIIMRVNSNNRSLSPLFYMPLAWLPILTIGHMVAIGGVAGIALIISGGAAYMAGVWFLTNDERAPYFHAVWHLLVIAGSFCHYLFLLRYVAMWPSA